MFEKITKVIDTPHDYATIWLQLPLFLWQKYPWLIQMTYWTLEVLWGDNLSYFLFLFTLLNKILYLHSSTGFLYFIHEFTLSPFRFQWIFVILYNLWVFGHELLTIGSWRLEVCCHLWWFTGQPPLYEFVNN